MAYSLTLPRQLREPEAQAERLPVTLFSERLGDSLVLAPDGTPELQIGGMAVYTPTETGESIPFLVEICGSGLVLNLYVARKPQFLLQGLSQCR